TTWRSNTCASAASDPAAVPRGATRTPTTGASMTTLQQLLGIELPIIQAPMAGVQGSALAIAVSNAGGLGSLPCAMLGPDALRAELTTIHQQTDRPYNVNFFCHQSPAADVVREAAWRAALAPYYREFGIDAAAIASAPARLPVIAAGGIADANGGAAALALGAAGAQVGTAYLLCPEATTSAVHRAALKSAAARHTALTNLFSGGPARGIVNRVMRELGPI